MDIENLEIRKEVLNESLKIEHALSEILMALLNINKNGSKTLGNKGTALSFKAKTDLLYDIGKISKVTYNRLIMFMEIRNQFIHNIDSNSFEVVIERNNKKKNFSNFISSYSQENNIQIEEHYTLEQKFELGFIFLTKAILEDLIKAHLAILDEKQNEIATKLKALKSENKEEMLKALSDAIDEGIALLNEGWENQSGEEPNIGELLKGTIQGIFLEKINKIEKS